MVGLKGWLRGRDLNPRPSGYEPDVVLGSLTFPASVYLGSKSAFQKRTSVLAYPLPFLCHFFCSDLIRKVLSCTARVLPDQV